MSSALLLTMLVSLAVMVVSGWLALAGNPPGVVLATVHNAVVAAVGGVIVATRGGTGPDRRFRVLVGVAIAMSGVGLLGLLLPGDGVGIRVAISSAAAVCAVLAISLRLAHLEALASLRAATESVAVGLSYTCAMWAVLYRSHGDAGTVLPTLLASGCVIGIAVTLLSRSRNLGLSITAVGAIGLILVTMAARWMHLTGVGGIDALVLRMPGQAPFWTLTVGGVLWASVGAGTGPRDWDEFVNISPRAERRVQLVLATLITASLLSLVIRVMVYPELDAATWWLLGGAVVAVWAREVVRALQSHNLLLRLGGLARTDSLTGLPNLRSLEHRLREIGRLRRGTVVVLTLDVDRFKDVNDILGHNRGDELLAAMGARLGELDQRAEAFRVGGDEFVVIAVEPDLHALTETVSAMVSEAAATIPDANRLALTSSLGVDVVRLESATAEELAASVVRSGHAMRKAKLNRVPMASYDEDMSKAHARRLLVEQRLREGLDAVEVWFQPIISLTQGRVVGAEALARWTDALVGVVPPDEFVEAAEDTGVIDALGRHVLRGALTGAVQSGLIAGGHTLSVNVSALQLRQSVFASGFLRELRSAGVPPGQVVIEVTESVLVQADDPAVATLAELRRSGARIALDDFGTGYSSLAYLTRLPVHSIKIDRSLTRRVGESRAEAITASIVQLAHELDLDVVLEGVETVEQEEWARRLGLDRLQGWLYSPAVDRADLTAMLHRQNRVG